MTKYTDGPYLRTITNDDGTWPRATTPNSTASPDIIPWGTAAPERSPVVEFTNDTSYAQDPAAQKQLTLNGWNNFYVRAKSLSSTSYPGYRAVVFIVPSTILLNPEVWFSPDHALSTNNTSQVMEVTDAAGNTVKYPYATIDVPGNEVGVTLNPFVWIPTDTTYHYAIALVLPPSATSLMNAYNNLSGQFDGSIASIDRWMTNSGYAAWRNLSIVQEAYNVLTCSTSLGVDRGGGFEIITQVSNALVGMDIEWTAFDDHGQNVIYPLVDGDVTGPLQLVRQTIPATAPQQGMSFSVTIPQGFHASSVNITIHTNGRPVFFQITKLVHITVMSLSSG